MIIFRESGRLGNQLFQYAALRTLCKENEKLVLLGFEDLQAVFSGINAKLVNMNGSKIERVFYRQIYKNFDYLSQKNVITRIHEPHDITSADDQSKMIYNSPLFNQIKFADQYFFQQDESSFEKSVILKLSINKKLLSFAKEFLNTLCLSYTPIFVHIRRGDYLNLKINQESAILPATYYRNCLDMIQDTVSNPFFIFASDDPFYVKDLFSDLRNSFISRFSSFEDFVIMTQCQGGILSASSFSWWAAYFANLECPDLTFLAPKYWLGHGSRIWHPRFIKSSFLNYVDV